MATNTETVMAQYLYIKHRLETVDIHLRDIDKKIKENIAYIEKIIKDENDKKQLKMDFPNPTKTNP